VHYSFIIEKCHQHDLDVGFYCSGLLGARRRAWPKTTLPIVPHPPYFSDLAPSDFWLFPTLKMGLRGRHFATVEDIKENADARLVAIKKEDFHQCSNNWTDRCNKYVRADGKYFEGH
jgi:hypothetical protein